MSLGSTSGSRREEFPWEAAMTAGAWVRPRHPGGRLGLGSRLLVSAIANEPEDGRSLCVDLSSSHSLFFNENENKERRNGTF